MGDKIPSSALVILVMSAGHPTRLHKGLNRLNPCLYSFAINDPYNSKEYVLQPMNWFERELGTRATTGPLSSGHQ